MLVAVTIRPTEVMSSKLTLDSEVTVQCQNKSVTACAAVYRRMTV